LLFLAINDSHYISIHWFQNMLYDLGNSSNLWFLKHVFAYHYYGSIVRFDAQDWNVSSLTV